MNLTDAVDFEYPENEMVKPLKNITLAEADSTETFKFKPFEYERGAVTKTAKGVINTIRDMQDLPEQVKIFGKRISFGFGGYFGDTEEETERKKLNLVTAERNLNEAQAERYKYTSGREAESLSYGVGGGIVNYGTMLIPAGLVGGGLKAVGATAKAVKGAEAAGLTTMGVMELAGQVQDKTPMKDGEIDVEAMTPEWARKATGGTIAYTGISALTEKYVGFGQQVRMWSKPIQWGGTVTSKALTTLKTAGKNALSEGMTEGIQDLEATGIGLLDGTLTMDKLPARLQQAWKSAIIGGIIGGGVGTAAAMKSARNVKKQLREMVAPVVGEQEAQTVAEAIYDAGTDDMTKAISIELELSSELKNKHGKVWNSMLAAVSKEIEGKPRFKAMTEDERASYANTVAKHFADQVLAEANYRGTTLDAILSASDIVYDNGIKLKRHINLYDALKNPEMIPPETKLRKKGMNLIQFLRSRGGIIDEGGDLKSRDAHKQYIGLINKNGMTLDDAALLAWQEGYLPSSEFNYGRPDINALLDAIDEGLRGHHRYNVIEEETATFKDALNDLAFQLENIGIDWKNMTAAEIEKAVDELPELQSLEREADFYANYEPDIGLSEDEQERLAIMTEGKEYPIIDEKDLPERYYQEGEDRDLVALHSISSRNLDRAIDFGGFPVPSIAIVKRGQEFGSQFGAITLVGNKDMIDPSRSRNEVYNRDIWSKTFPFATYGKVKKKTRDDFRDTVKEYFVKSDSENELGSLLYYVDRGVSPEKAVTEFEDSDGARLMYLEKEKGKKIDIPTYDTAQRLIENINSQYGIEVNKEFVEKIAEFESYPSKEVMEKDILPLINEAIDNSKYDGKEKYANRLREVARSLFIEDGKVDEFNIEGLIRRCKEYVREKGTKKIDKYALRDKFDELITDYDDYSKWAKKYIEDNLVGEPMVEVGKRLLPFNLENVTKAMTQGITKNAQESFVYGSGKVIAAGAKQLKSIKEIKLEGKKLVSKEEQEEKIKELQDDMNEFTNKFMTSSDFTSSMEQKEAAFRALGTVTEKENPTNEDMQKALNYEFGNSKKYSDELLAAGVRVAKSSRNIARYYFEAKPQRAVGLNEFSGAIMPTSTEFDAIAKKAEDAGLKVVRSDNQIEALEQFDNVFFQRGKNAKGVTQITPDEYIIKLLEGADESTLPHEFAHYWLTEMWNYTRTGRASEKYMKRWQIISDYLGIKPEQTRLTRGQQEKFASSYEAYLTRGELPTPLIGSVFDDYDKWLQRVYSNYNRINYQSGYGKRRVRLTDAAIKFFQSMTTGTLEPPALAPKDTGVEVPQTVSAEEVIEPTNEIIETPTTYDTTRVINITEGEKGVSKVFQREAMKHAERIVDELGVSYNKINLEEQAIKAAEWVQNNLEEARKVVNGAAAPEGIIDTAIFIAYENEMLRIGNNAEYQRALKIHSQVQTQRGQAIAAERISTDDVYNPAYWWKKLQKNKETDVARKLFKGDVKALNEAVETETKKLMQQIAGKSKEEQVEALTKLAEKLQKDYNLDTLYQMPEEINERTVKEFVKDVFGINPTLIEGSEVTNKAEQLQKLWDNTKDKSGNPSVEAMRAKRELNDLINAKTPSNALAIWTSIFGRGIMLTSVKSPVLNIISNIEAGFTEGITRRLMYGTTEKAVDKTVKEEFSKYAWEVYKASADIVTTMNDYDDDMRIIGEQILHSQGEGLLRAASRKVEEVSFKYLMGAPDVYAKRLAFNDTADLLATKIAREEGAKDVSKRATEIYKDAILIKPQTEVGQKVREQAQAQAHYTTFTNDSWAARFGLSARNWLNMVGRNKIRLGDLTMKFVKTPANVQMMGLEYGFGLLYTAYNVQEIIKNPQSETSKIAIRAAVRNGLGVALAALLYSMLDPDDYFSEFDTLNPKEKDRMRAMGAIPNSIKIGNKWVSLDYFGQLGIPLVGMLEARRNNGLRSYIQSGLTQAAKIPGIKETKQLIDNMSEYARYDLKPEKIAQMMAGTVLDQARAMTIPAIVNDIAKMTDDYERDTMGGVMDKVISSIPGLRQTLPERYGIQGLVRTEPALSTLLFGSRVKTEQSDKLVREVEKLAGKDEQPSISDVTKYGDLRLLSPEKKVKVRKEFYKLYNTESKKLISTREYQKKTPEDKKKALNKVRSRVVKSLKEKYSNDIQREKRRR